MGDGLISNSWGMGGSAFTDDEFRVMFDAELFDPYCVDYLLHLWGGNLKKDVYIAGFKGAFSFLNLEEYLTIEYTRKYTLGKTEGGGTSFTYTSLRCVYHRHDTHALAEITTWQGSSVYGRVKEAKKDEYKIGKDLYLFHSLGLAPLYKAGKYLPKNSLNDQVIFSEIGDDPKIETNNLNARKILGEERFAAHSLALFKDEECIEIVFFRKD